MIKRKWYNSMVIVMGVFAVTWNTMLWTIFVPNFSREGGMFSLILFPFVGVGIFLGYSTIAGLVNTTTIKVNDATFSVRHHPLPFPGSHLASTDIEQLYTKQRISRSKNGTRISYQLHALLQDGRDKALIKNLTSSEQALYVEQEVERFLDIENIPVSGEYRS